MDSLITAAARALATGDPLGALKRVALRDDPPALALRGIAMAQLGEHPRARELLRRAARGFGAQEELSRARCVVAEAEVALAMRDVGESPRELNAALATLEARNDHINAMQARLVAARRSVLLGRLAEAAAALAPLDAQGLPPLVVAAVELTRAELALRGLHTGLARAALDRAQQAAERSGVPALVAEVAHTRTALEQPAARLLSNQAERLLRLDEVEALLGSHTLVIDACRLGVHAGGQWLPLTGRPVLFALVRALAHAWPGDVDRRSLIERVFRTRRPDETHRARLRVEMGRLRALVAGMAHIGATPQGFALRPQHGLAVAVLAPPVDGEEASLRALLADGAAWSTSALAQALGVSQRTVQRALADLEAAGLVRSLGQARARRWLAPPLTGFTTILLLPASLPFE
jgi:DNA-binding transcriptional ArsR family regulator